MEIVVKFTNFNFCYQNLADASLSNINLEIFAGEKILIAGRSGSGKSTLLHCINGIIPFSSFGEITGSMIIKGVANPNGIIAISKKVGTILQDQDSQFIGLSVAEDVAFVLENNAESNETMNQIVQTCLTQVNMQDYSEHSPYELSGGQKQCISLAGILASSPDILLFDEPLANLDPLASANVVQLIEKLNRTEKKTIIIAEHRIEEILEARPDRIIVMEGGKIVFCGTPKEVLSSQILEQTGIRPPLYTQLLKVATPYLVKPEIDNLSQIKQLNPEAIQNIRNWTEQISLPEISAEQSVTEVLNINNISFSYSPGQEVLKNISFSLARGEIVSILGNNGAGKSSLSYVMSGILRPTAGSILLEGLDISQWTIKQRGAKIGLVMQNHNSMLVKASVKDEVALGLKNLKLAASLIEQKIEQVLRSCNLWGYRNWPTTSLSYGQKKRVTIASMLALDLKVLILDEPTAGQDLRTYHEFMQFLTSLAKSGIAIIVITHDLYLAMEYTSRSIVLAKGEKIADDKPSKVFANQEVLNKAHLKEISLSPLARHAGIAPELLIQKFINHKQAHYE